MSFLQRALRVVAPVAVGGVVAALSLGGTAKPTPSAARGECYSGLRLLRHAIASYEAQHGHLPDLDLSRGQTPDHAPEGSAELLVLELTQPRDAAGRPDRSRGPFPGLIGSVPVNPFTGSNALTIVPPGVDAVAFAAASPAGWAYLARPGRDAGGLLPPGLLLPCGDARRVGKSAPVQDLTFEIEDFERWR